MQTGWLTPWPATIEWYGNLLWPIPVFLTNYLLILGVSLFSFLFCIISYKFKSRSLEFRFLGSLGSWLLFFCCLFVSCLVVSCFCWFLFVSCCFYWFLFVICSCLSFTMPACGEPSCVPVLINNLDTGNPLHVQTNDNISTTLIRFKL